MSGGGGKVPLVELRDIGKSYGAIIALRDKLKATESAAHHALALVWLTVAILYFTKV